MRNEKDKLIKDYNKTLDTLNNLISILSSRYLNEDTIKYWKQDWEKIDKADNYGFVEVESIKNDMINIKEMIDDNEVITDQLNKSFQTLINRMILIDVGYLDLVDSKAERDKNNENWDSMCLDNIDEEKDLIQNLYITKDNDRASRMDEECLNNCIYENKKYFIPSLQKVVKDPSLLYLDSFFSKLYE